MKLFHEDAYRSEFTTNVLSAVYSEPHWEIVLAESCFYADAGGQPSDIGTLGNRHVLGVREAEDGTLIHITDGPVEGTVTGQIDTVRRLDHMEQHTGQHLLSGVFETLFDIETVSWHLGARTCTIDLAHETLSAEQVEHAETECNRLIRRCLPVVTHLVNEHELSVLPVRKPPKLKENIRVVEIQGYDWSACGGTHVRNIGELGLLKIKAWEKNKRYMRVEFLVGQRALADYIALDQITRTLCRSLTIAVAELPQYAARSQAEQSALHKQVQQLRGQLLEAEALALIESSRRIGGTRVVRTLFGGRPLDDIKMLAAKVAAHPSTVALFATKGAMPQIVMHRSVDLRLDVGAIIRQVLPIIDGKGGGSPVQAQGGGSRPDTLEQALDQAIQKIADALHHG